MEEFPPVGGSGPRLDAPLAFAVRRKDLVRFGYTMGCERCCAAWSGGMQQAHDAHCRGRAINELMKIAVGQARIEEDEQQRVKRARGPAEPERRAPARLTRPPELTVGPPTLHAGGSQWASIGATDACHRGSWTVSGIKRIRAQHRRKPGHQTTLRLEPEPPGTQDQRRLD